MLWMYETFTEKGWGAVQVAMSQRASCCADRVTLAVQKAWLKPSGESEQVCMSQELGGEGSC